MVINNQTNDKRNDNNSDVDDDEKIDETDMRFIEYCVNNNDGNLVSGKNECHESICLVSSMY